MNTISEVPQPTSELIELAKEVRSASVHLGQTEDEQRCKALLSMAAALEARSDQIVKANQKDLAIAEKAGMASALISRLRMDRSKLLSAIEGVEQVSQLSDPLGLRQLHRELDQGLELERVTVPLGVIGVIFEARPDAVIQIASLAIRSGNGAILKGGREAEQTNKAIMFALQEGLESTDVSNKALALLTTREESLALLRLDGLVDLIIPRGSNELVRFIRDNTRIPVLGHADGVCHLYIDEAADLQKALRIALDSKTQYPAACNAIETLLIHERVVRDFLAIAIPAFTKANVHLLGDSTCVELGVEGIADDKDWAREYLDLILSIKVVSNFDGALEHIRKYGSRHTEAIVTEDKQIAERFLHAVDSSGVYHNCSTRFADGFRYGFGAEVGISTQTLPPRGPVGLEGLVTYRYFLRGDGHLTDEYAKGYRKFTHRSLPL